MPDRYRFLLFEDKREVELVWNGKTNEICNIVLPFQTIEQVDEPRAEQPEETHSPRWPCSIERCGIVSRECLTQHWTD